ncbi:MAG: PHP domain-containing protein [Coriobacteriia bacterium]|nr:PHP domain-containing protein [Coriobacteriia bacterium]
MRADLHVHSTASDGTVAPSELVALALTHGVDVLAIADHDSVAGLGEASQAAQGTGLVLIPAVELSSVAGAIDVHILAYHVDPLDPSLLSELTHLRDARMRRATRMVAALAEAGHPVTLAEVLALSDGGAVGRSHVARALVGAGAAESVSEAFRRYIGRGMPFYVPKDARPPEEVIGFVRSIGAVPVLAHPGVTDADELLEDLIAAGLLGIEAFHADHTPEQRQRYASYARERGLLVTGGTDYHGPASPNPELGSCDVPTEDILALLAAGSPSHDA